MPFDHTTFIGFWATTLLSAVSSYVTLIMLLISCTFFQGVSLYVIACLDNLMAMFAAIDELLNAHSHRITQSTRIRIKQHLTKIIKFHIQIDE